MDSVHIHLLLNHVPILGVLFAAILLGLGLLRRNKTLEQAGLVTLVVVALATIPVFFSGEGAEERVESLAGVSEHFLEEHEELGEIGLWLMLTTGLLALVALVLSSIQQRLARGLKVLVLLMSLGTFAMMVLVGAHGGKIRHDELRSGDQQESPASDHDDDD